MNDNMIDRDYMKAELEYRLNRIQSDISSRRFRRSRTRRGATGDTTFGTFR